MEPETTTLYLSNIDKYVLFDKKHEETIKKHHWHANNRGYAVTNIKKALGKRTLLLMHRYIMQLEGHHIAGNEFDHKNRDRLDNRLSNIRIASRKENATNASKRRDNTSGYKGVSFHKFHNKWGATTHFGGKSHHLGYYQTAIEAAIAYNNFLSKRTDIFESFKVYNEIKD